MRLGIIAIVLMLSCIGMQLHAESQPPAKAESGPDEQAGTSPVVIIQPQGDANPLPKKDRMLTDEEAYDLVWNLPDVKREIEKILNQGGVPLATIGTRPSPDSREEEKPFYTIRFQGVNTKSIFIDLLFYVDAFTRQVLVYDSSAGSLISLDDWRRRNK
ncbi:MAG TPA: hypothetical protein VLX12_08275 [Syntrophorhabdales bacterium]|nr:hypothetical protein [Syntrophorhabdales bacterium]